MKDDLRVEEIEAKPKTKTAKGGRWWMFVVAVAGLVGAGVAVRYFIASRHFEKTDDSFLQATVTVISPQVSGRVEHVYVIDNQAVNAGDVLVEIDHRPLEAQLARERATADLARAHIETAKLNVTLTQQTTGADIDNSRALVDSADASIAQAEAAVKSAEADAVRAKEDAARYEGLLKQKIAAAQQRDAAVASSRMADAKVDESRKALAAARANAQSARAKLAQSQTAPQQIAVTQSQIKQYEAELAQAEASARQIEVDLSYTKIIAPAHGTITRKAVHEGETVQVGQALFSLVQRDFWVEANYKETQLTDMRVGQPAEIKIDAFGGRTFKARVQSIQSGTGAQFALLPPQNATGNYVKVVQRVPVKIVFDEPLAADLPLVPGMSVVPKVRVR